MNNNPLISWFILEDIDSEYIYVPKKKHDEEESYMPGDTMLIKAQVWNNRGGQNDAADAANAKLVAYFKNYEDNFYLRLIQVKVSDEEYRNLEIDIDRGYLELGSLSGKANNGSEMNYDNYYNLEIKLGPMPSNMRSEIKNLILDIDYDNTKN